ncbi:hypothetical protein [Azospirillum sp. ST 5-10]|uniref:hypothetical protein n=1 Tax=unclassified Azospirillum TaxID=2630922 RepID=UPI003F4A12A6
MTPRRYPVPDFLAPLARSLEQRDVELGAPLSEQAYTVSGYTETRTLNASTATAADVANFVCTLVADLQRADRLL